MDALIILRFFKSSAFLFGILTLFGCVVVVPINWVGGAIPAQAAANEAAGNGPTPTNQEIEVLRMLSIENIPGDSPLLIVHYVCVFLFNIFLWLNVQAYYKSAINTRVQTIERVSKKRFELVYVANLRSLRSWVRCRDAGRRICLGSRTNFILCPEWWKRPNMLLPTGHQKRRLLKRI
jgi:hypothetical protein